MTKNEFLSSLSQTLAELPEQDVAQSLAYYSEMIDDYMENGMTEEEAVETLGSVEEVSAQILADVPVQDRTEDEPAPRKSMEVWKIVLLILGSPLWFPLLITAASVLVSVYVTIWAVVISLYTVVASFAAGALGGMLGCVAFGFRADAIQAVLFLGGGPVCAGLAIFSFFGCNQVAKGVVWLSRTMWLWLGRCFWRRGDAE